MEQNFVNMLSIDVNFHKILHGDWFAGKGLGVVTLDFKGLNVHVRELIG